MRVTASALRRELERLREQLKEHSLPPPVFLFHGSLAYLSTPEHLRQPGAPVIDIRFGSKAESTSDAKGSNRQPLGEMIEVKGGLRY